MTDSIHPRLVEEIRITREALDADNGRIQSIEYLKAVEGLVADTKRYTAAVRTSDGRWGDISLDLDSIFKLLHDFRCDLERTASLSDQYCFTPRNNKDDYRDIPDYFRPALQELCSNLRRVISTLQRYCVYRGGGTNALWISNSVDEIGQCCNSIKSLLNNISTILLPKSIYDAPLDIPYGDLVCLDIMKEATPARYRLVDCSRLIQNEALRIYEFVHFPHVQYTAISYVWRGNDVSTGQKLAEFSVVGAEEADPIGIEVLHDACQASLSLGIPYLWIDRLCIMQTNKDDKTWQIREMFRMYRSCATCIVIPGGLRMLVPISTETHWIHRGWALQEATAPPSVSVLFAWKLGSGMVRTGDDTVGLVEEVVQGRSALVSLSFLLDSCSTGSLVFENRGKSLMVEAKTFSSQPFNHTYSDIPFWRPTRRIMSPNVTSLAIAMSKDMDDDEKQYAIWQSALMRTSSRPVDMVFSIMGLFGVTLNTKAFFKNDRLGATIELGQQILEQGGRANWLGISFRIAPCPQLSTFPTFPKTRVAGKALIKVTSGGYREVSQLVEGVLPNADALVPMPQGSMDADGYLHFNAKAVRLMPSSMTVNDPQYSDNTHDSNRTAPKFVTALDGTVWEILEEGGGWDSQAGSVKAFAVLLGFFHEYYPGATPAITKDNVRAMLI